MLHNCYIFSSFFSSPVLWDKNVNYNVPELLIKVKLYEKVSLFAGSCLKVSLDIAMA